MHMHVECYVEPRYAICAQMSRHVLHCLHFLVCWLHFLVSWYAFLVFVVSWFNGCWYLQDLGTSWTINV